MTGSHRRHGMGYRKHGRDTSVPIALLVFIATVLAAVLTPAPAAPVPGPAVGRPSGRWVTVPRPLGRVSRPIRVYMGNEEIRVVARIQRMIDELPRSPSPPLEGHDITWHIEPGVERSPTLTLQQKVLFALDKVIEPAGNATKTWPLHIVIGRTQRFIRSTLSGMDCNPDLARFGGVFLMGAAVCGRHFVVSNITGYLFLLRADQEITDALEKRAEPRINETPYKLVMRNSSALAHEYVHIWRAAGLQGLVRPDEPQWFSEGFAEFWSGVAKVVAYPGRVTWLTHHVVRERDFYDWAHACPLPLSAYRTASPERNGCEYHVGMIAVELLYARYHSLQKTVDAFKHAAEYRSFAEGFMGTFGITLEQFEAEADRYVSDMRRSTLGH